MTEGLKNVAAGAIPLPSKRGIDKAVKKAVEEIQRIAIPVEGKNALPIGAIAGNDPSIGELPSVKQWRKSAMMESLL